MLSRLAAAQVAADLRLQRGIDRLAKVVPQQDIFAGDGGIGLQLVDPVPVALLLGQQRGGGAADHPLQRIARRRIRSGKGHGLKRFNGHAAGP